MPSLCIAEKAYFWYENKEKNASYFLPLAKFKKCPISADYSKHPATLLLFSGVKVREKLVDILWALIGDGYFERYRGGFKKSRRAQQRIPVIDKCRWSC